MRLRGSAMMREALTPVDATGTDEVAALNRCDSHKRTGARRLDHLAIADVDAEVMDGITVEQEVAGFEVGEGHAVGHRELHGGTVGERDTRVSPRHHGQSRTVETAGPLAAPEIWLADLRQRPCNDNVALRMRDVGIGFWIGERVNARNCRTGRSRTRGGRGRAGRARRTIRRARRHIV